MRGFKGEIVNNLAKLSELDKQLAHDRGKLKEIKGDTSYSKKLKERIPERIENAETEREARLGVLSINKKELRSQVSRIKETLAEISDSNTSPLKKLWILLRQQWILLTTTFTSILTLFLQLLLH